MVSLLTSRTCPYPPEPISFVTLKTLKSEIVLGLQQTKMPSNSSISDDTVNASINCCEKSRYENCIAAETTKHFTTWSRKVCPTGTSTGWAN